MRSILVLVKAPELNSTLNREQAIELLDGVTDIAVVTCGLALSLGLPGPEGYSEVVGSNLSKANPRTGLIDKTPDGKWIKGEMYVKPDLGRVLDEVRDEDGPAW